MLLILLGILGFAIGTTFIFTHSALLGICLIMILTPLGCEIGAIIDEEIIGRRIRKKR